MNLRLIKKCFILCFLAKRRRCKNDSECNISKCEYCASEGYCIEYLDDWCEVSSNMCGNGDGDCDPYDNKEECKSGHICGHNNLLKIHPNLANLPPNCDTKNDEKVEKADACVKEGILLKLHCYIFF